MKSAILAALNSPSNLFQVVSGNGNSAYLTFFGDNGVSGGCD